MSFASLPFVGLVAAGVILYYLIPKQAQWVVLLLASMVFYLSGGVKSAVWLVLVAGLTWLAGLLLEKQNARPAPDKAAKTAVRSAKKRICAACLVLCFGLLYLMKYWNFTASALPSALGDKLPRWDFVVPLGLSYFIFQSVGYVIDVYRGKLSAQKNPLKYGLFVSFFPQMVQGPISRYDQLAPQLLSQRSLDWRDLKLGIQLCLWGYFKKLVIADRAAVLVNAVITENCPYGGAIIASGILFYCIQLYCDFSGGIDLVAGIAELFGIRLAENFRRPYFAVSLGDFWRRWHISLGAWMRDYVFYPFALSRPVSRLSKAAKGRFGAAFARALPAALTDILLVGGVMLFYLAADLPDTAMSTICAGVMGVVGLMMVHQTAKPYNKLRIAMICVLALGFAGSFLFLKALFNLVTLDFLSALVLAVFALLAWPVMNVMYKLLDKLSAFVQRRKETRRAAKEL